MLLCCCTAMTPKAGGVSWLSIKRNICSTRPKIFRATTVNHFSVEPHLAVGKLFLKLFRCHHSRFLEHHNIVFILTHFICLEGLCILLGHMWSCYRVSLSRRSEWICCRVLLHPWVRVRLVFNHLVLSGTGRVDFFQDIQVVHCYGTIGKIKAAARGWRTRSNNDVAKATLKFSFPCKHNIITHLGSSF